MSVLVLIDLDGVLANDEHRIHLALAKKWSEYFNLMWADPVWPCGIDLYETIREADLDIEYLTGRREDTRKMTVEWLAASGVFDATLPLNMRPFSNRTLLAQLKAGFVRDKLSNGKYHFVLLFDDDPRVIEEVNGIPSAVAVHCQWSKKPEELVRKAAS